GTAFLACAASSGPREDVADAAHRLDEARILRVLFELLSQARDVDVERPVDARIVRLRLPLLVNRRGELFACHGLARALRELDQDPELERRERDVRARATDGACREIDLDGPHRDAALRLLRARAAEHGAHAREELARVERFGDI